MSILKVCKRCHRYSVFEENVSFCPRCRRQVEKNISFRLDDTGFLFPVASNGMIFSKNDWYILKSQVDKFYLTYSYDDIDAMNEVTLAKRKAIRATEDQKSGYVYLLKSDNGYYKIGKSSQLEKRLYQLEREYPIKITLVCVIYSDQVSKLEVSLHRKYVAKRFNGTEWFKLSSEDVAYLEGLADSQRTI